MYTSKFKTHLTVQVTLITVVITTICLILLGMYRYRSIYLSLKEELNHTLQLTTIRIATSVAGPVYNYFDPGIVGVIKSEMENAAILGVFVYDPEKDVPRLGFIRNKDQIVSGNLLKSHQYLVFEKIISYAEEKNLGKVKVFISEDSIKPILKKSLIVEIIQIIILDIILVIFMVFFFHKRFIYPIRSLTKTTSQIANGSLDQHIYTQDRVDEIGTLAQSEVNP